MNKKVIAIIKREYLTRVKTKGFIIGTLIFPLILIFIFSGIFILGTLFKPATKTFYIIDQTHRLFAEFKSELPDTLRNGEMKYNLIEKILSQDNLDTALASFQKEILEEKIDGYIVIPENIIESREASCSARNVSDFEEFENFQRILSRIVTNMRLERIGLSPEEIREEMNLGRIKLNSRQVTDKGEIQKSGFSSFGLAYILTYVILLLIMIYGQTLMRSVIEEKTQRITETIISSVKPIELMLGKIIGVCAVGITQLAVIGLFLLLMVTYSGILLFQWGLNSPELLDFLNQIQFSAPVYGFMLVFFLLGFIFYATIFAGIGAMVNTEDEGQQFQMPVIFMIVIGYFIMFTVARNPDTSTAFWVSLIPLYTPLVMFARIAVSDPVIPSGAYLSIITQILFTILLIWFVSRIYRVGILMYGKKPSLKEALKWIRYK